MNALIDTKITLDKIDCLYIKQVFDNNIGSLSMLTIQEFIQKSNFPIDSFMVDNFFDNLNNDIPIYVTNELIEWCGYSGKLSHQKESFNKLLSNFDEGKDYWIYSNKEYREYYDKSMSVLTDIESIQIDQSKYNYPHPDIFIGKNKTKHLVLTIQCFKMVLMMLNTTKSHSIRLYYISLEKLIKTYAKYQLYYEKNMRLITERYFKEEKGAA